MVKKAFILGIFLHLCAYTLFAQLNAGERRSLKTANNYFDNEQFAEALPLFLKIDSLVDDYQLTYRIGACYLNTKYEKLKALPYLEYLINNMSLEVPLIVYNDLGTLYHYSYRFDEAIEQFRKYLEESKKDAYAQLTDKEYAKRMIAICENAIEITTQPFNAEIDILSSVINTMESEFCPMITADEQTLVYMRTIGLGNSMNQETHIMISHKNETGEWEEPKKLSIDVADKFMDQSILLAGLSADGQTLFLNIGIGVNQDIYEATITNDIITALKKLNKTINTPYYEGRVSMTSDGTELYFVSDRPGGFGGTDIYKATRNRRGDWDEAVNIGNTINTAYNENSPFIHPDNVSLFFSSEGHKTMGGSDIFKSRLTNQYWTVPENMGFLNSPKDDLYFVLNANGQVGYFSTSKNNVFDKHNIFKVNLKDPIPLTLLKGTILSGIPPKPIGADIKVYDKETGQAVKYVYNPDPETGKYLMIFPPAKNYNIVISSDEFLPQLINVFIPYQTYFYELYQEIILQPITLENKMVGEQITVNNTFYDLYKTSEADSILVSENLPKQPKYYDHLLELIENIIQTTDTLRVNYQNVQMNKEKQDEGINSLLNLIEEAIETTNPVTLSILDANARQKDQIKNTHFYTDGNKSQSTQMQVIGADTFYTAAPIISHSSKSEPEQRKAQTSDLTEKKEINFRTSDPGDRRYIHKHTIYFNLNDASIAPEYEQELLEICRLLIDNKTLGAEIYGFTDALGGEKYNLSLSRKRAQNVLRFLLDNYVAFQKLIVKGLGEVNEQDATSGSVKWRKVEINIFEINPR